MAMKGAHSEFSSLLIAKLANIPHRFTRKEETVVRARLRNSVPLGSDRHHHTGPLAAIRGTCAYIARFISV